MCSNLIFFRFCSSFYSFVSWIQNWAPQDWQHMLFPSVARTFPGLSVWPGTVWPHVCLLVFWLMRPGWSQDSLFSIHHSGCTIQDIHALFRTFRISNWIREKLYWVIRLKSIDYCMTAHKFWQAKDLDTPGSILHWLRCPFWSLVLVLCWPLIPRALVSPEAGQVCEVLARKKGLSRKSGHTETARK